MGCLRNAAFKDVPVSTSERMSLRSFVTLAFVLPRPTMSKTEKGTPAFIIVASCRVKSAMSLGLIFSPSGCVASLFLWENALTAKCRLDLIFAYSPDFSAHHFTCTIFSSHSKTNSLMSLDAAVAIDFPCVSEFYYSLVTAKHFFEGSEPSRAFVQTGLSRSVPLVPGLFCDFECTAITQNDALNFF